MNVDHTPGPWEWHAQGEANEYCLLTHDVDKIVHFAYQKARSAIPAAKP